MLLPFLTLIGISVWNQCRASKTYSSVEVNVAWMAAELMTSFMRSELLIACLWFSNVPLKDLFLFTFCESSEMLRLR